MFGAGSMVLPNGQAQRCKRMKANFWHERWARGEIGFHQREHNRHLKDFIHHLEIPAGSTLLVPLCGKSLDMLWLAHQGYRVTGIELSEVAARDFYRENGLGCEVLERNGVTILRGAGIEIFRMDFFTLDAMDLPSADAIYDRAALVALPPDMRPKYAKRLTGLIEPGRRILLVTMDYPQTEMRGPPFSVPVAEVESLFGPRCEIQRLRTEECLEREPRFKEKGLSRLEEHVLLLRRKCGV